MKAHAATWITSALLIVGVCGAEAGSDSAREKLILTKNVSAYTHSDTMITVRELEFPPGFLGHPHRHPGPVVVCILDGEVEIQLEGQPLRSYKRGQCFTEDPLGLHRYTRNPSTTATARVLSYILSKPGEPLSLPEQR